MIHLSTLVPVFVKIQHKVSAKFLFISSFFSFLTKKGSNSKGKKIKVTRKTKIVCWPLLTKEFKKGNTGRNIGKYRTRYNIWKSQSGTS